MINSSQVYLGTNPDAIEINWEEYETEEEKDKNEEKEEEENYRIKSEKYLGAQEDKEWMDNIRNIAFTEEQKIYSKLVEKMGVFKWQSSHGFRSNQYRGLRYCSDVNRNTIASID